MDANVSITYRHKQERTPTPIYCILETNSPLNPYCQVSPSQGLMLHHPCHKKVFRDLIISRLHYCPFNSVTATFHARTHTHTGSNMKTRYSISRNLGCIKMSDAGVTGPSWVRQQIKSDYQPLLPMTSATFTQRCHRVTSVSGHLRHGS